jgi:hypothetical protein
MTILLTGLDVWTLSGLIVAGLLARHGHNFWLLALMRRRPASSQYRPPGAHRAIDLHSVLSYPDIHSTYPGIIHRINLTGHERLQKVTS